MRLKIRLEDIHDPAVEDEVVLVGMVVGRRWEQEHGEAVGAALDARPPSVLVELAHIAYNRKHGRHLTIDEFEDRFEVDVDNSGDEPSNPSEPATDPPSE
jgi:hypothetical protein